MSSLTRLGRTNDHAQAAPFKRALISTCVSSALAVSLALASASALSDARDQAKRIHDRLAGVPPTAQFLDDNVVGTTVLSNPDEIANLAMENDAFYNVTLKNFVAPWTNEEQSVFVPLNDYIATVIGMIRDDLDFRLVLSDDILYKGDSGLGLPAIAANNNDHYEALESGGYPLKTALVRTTQSSETSLPPEATAGIMTTRQAAQEYFSGGTNRAMFRFTLMHHLCNDLEQVKDVTRPPDRIRQDVSRSPGGDSRIFLNSCIGCHSGMDPMAQAFAYYEWNYDADAEGGKEAGNLVYTAGVVQDKYHINSGNFRWGYVTPDDHWDNYWREGQNTLLGWDAGLSGSGDGAKTMGEELAHSTAFAQCQVKKVFKAVCLRDPSTSADRSEISSLLTTFSSNGYAMKPVFAEAAVYCMGD